MINSPFAPWPSFSEEEAQAVHNVLLSNKVNYWTGSEGHKFEREFAHFTECEHAVAVANGTVALELALRALDIGKGDEVVVTPRSFIASASAIVMTGATPVFADVSPDSQNITPDTIVPCLTAKTKAIVCVHLAGFPCDMDPIMDLSREKNLYVIEDCAQAHGASYRGRSVGSIGHVGAWSFCQDKIMSTGGEGGMVTTNNRKLWLKMWAYKDHGKSWEAIYGPNRSTGTSQQFRWLHESFGTNWRMTEMQAAIGRIQLRKMPFWHQRRLHNALAIQSVGKHLPGLRIPVIPKNIEHAWYKCYLFTQPDELETGWNRNRIMERIGELGVPCFSGACSEMYLEKAFHGTNWAPTVNLPIAKHLGETSLMFLVHPTLSDDEIEKTTDVLSTVMHEAALAR